MEGVCSLFELVNPQMLSHQTLAILVRRTCDRKPDTMTKEQLLEFVINQIAPKAQRTYRDNQPGKRLKRNQLSQKRSLDSQKSEYKPVHKLLKSDQSPGSRLKPPPVAVQKRSNSDNSELNGSVTAGKRTKITWP